jgi:hypothetical protein
MKTILLQHGILLDGMFAFITHLLSARMNLILPLSKDIYTLLLENVLYYIKKKFVKEKNKKLRLD